MRNLAAFAGVIALTAMLADSLAITVLILDDRTVNAANAASLWSRRTTQGLG